MKSYIVHVAAFPRTDDLSKHTFHAHVEVNAPRMSVAIKSAFSHFKTLTDPALPNGKRFVPFLHGLDLSANSR